MQKITIGDVEIIAVTDGTGLVLALDQTFPTVQPAQWEPYYQRYPRVFTNSSNWYLHYGCFVVRTREHTLLVDTGVGPGPYMGVVYGQRPRGLDPYCSRHTYVPKRPLHAARGRLGFLSATSSEDEHRALHRLYTDTPQKTWRP